MKDCIFCRIVAGEIPAKVVHQDDEIVALRDANPQAPVHLLLVPRRHIASLNDVEAADGPLLGRLLLVAQELATSEGVGEGYRLVNNCGRTAGQSVFHLHLHLLGGRPMGWPPG